MSRVVGSGLPRSTRGAMATECSFVFMFAFKGCLFSARNPADRRSCARTESAAASRCTLGGGHFPTEPGRRSDGTLTGPVRCEQAPGHERRVLPRSPARAARYRTPRCRRFPERRLPSAPHMREPRPHVDDVAARIHVADLDHRFERPRSISAICRATLVPEKTVSGAGRCD